MASAIIVFSHLRWDFVYQRPQHLLTRLSKHFPIVVVEEPILHDGEPFMKTYAPAPNILVCQPHTPVRMPGFHDDQLPHLQKLVRQAVQDYDEHIAWFYTPMALPLLQALRPRLVVYDCMDELAAFRNAPKQLLQRESAVLKLADIVFTGGPSLYRAKRDRHPNVHCFPSSVDVTHFKQALDRANSHPAHRSIPGPRLGFYGVIDERFDVDLVGQLADAHPQWQIVLVGPVVKVDPAILPQRPNIHYLGPQPYEVLPNFLAGWDVCLLPFAINESTRYISPTKTLEYMAAELPIVSTPVADVADNYSDIVAIAGDAPAFIRACEAALLAPRQELLEKVEKMRAVLAATSWDATATRMRELMEQAASRRVEPSAGENIDVNPLRRQAVLRDAAPARRHVILGAGPAGLSTAFHLGADTLLLEKHDRVGGWCRSIHDKGFTFDQAGHAMFASDPYVMEMYRVLLGENQHWQEREAWIYSKQTYTRYPFERALYGLPASVVNECILGAIDAAYGAGATVDASGRVTPLERRAPANFEEFIHQLWGVGMARHFVLPYNRKLWTIPLSEMEVSWLGQRSPRLNLEEVVSGALQPSVRQGGAANCIGYPLRGGFQALMEGFLPHIKGDIELNADVVKICPGEHEVALADGRRFRYDSLVNTMPLPELVKRMGDEAPPEVRDAARGLRHVSVRSVNLGIARENITDKHWIYYPEDTVFHRIFAQGNASPACNPPGGFGLTCEITYSGSKPLPADGQELIARCIADCIRVGLLRPEDEVLTAHQVDMPYAYVIHDHERTRRVALIRDWLIEQDILLAGRFGEWAYYNADHAFLAGKRAAEALLNWEAPKKSAGAE
ncbi:Protoporphyrinogen oxidase [Noviherbaspirillum humi]|uniref:Protoporphyrinogen oxidase n=1 Tax=Noviherbaspirillum humi TaxID=1688639 RepID=A0A239DTW6_9BURK|nr:FAD-dependent oxidoreductase [Noviherbaspirillum humi]SNS35571.1 Protoporphyrinogen oxidase [Noviherbaspirillum humi]